MAEYFQFLDKPESTETHLEKFLDSIETKIPARAEINLADAVYQSLLIKVLRKGKYTSERTGTGAIKIFGDQLKFDLSDGKFPLLTTKKVFTKGVLAELLWFLKGSTNVKPLQEEGVHIWDEWADEVGDLGPIYGSQWRGWGAADGRKIDQLSAVIDKIKKSPFDRRLIVSSWNVGELDQMALPPCHLFYQFDVEPSDNGPLLNSLWLQRSVDSFLGLPFNIVSYAALTHMVAQVTHTKPNILTAQLGNIHIYTNHLKQVLVQLSRDPYPSPSLHLNPSVKNIDDFRLTDFEVVNYKSHPKIEAPISV